MHIFFYYIMIMIVIYGIVTYNSNEYNFFLNN